ncbi:MAG: hypothetical protein GX050_07675 [Firmicutes bacterium]|nr:hypothetical protein [Bacillota bacterium]
MRKHFLLFWLACCILLLAGCFSPPPGEEETAAYRGLSQLLPAVQHYNVSIINPEDVLLYAYEKKVTVEPESGQLTILDTGRDYEYTGYLDRDFRLLESNLLFKKAVDIEKLGYDQRVTTCRADEGVMEFTVLTGGEVLYTKEIALEEQAYDLETFCFFVQALQNKGLNTFQGNVINMNNGQLIAVEMKPLGGRELQRLLDKKNLPSRLRSLEEAEHYFYVMGVTGWSRIFLTYKFYLILERQAPHRVKAFWGDNPTNRVIQWFEARD